MSRIRERVFGNRRFGKLNSDAAASSVVVLEAALHRKKTSLVCCNARGWSPRRQITELWYCSGGPSGLPGTCTWRAQHRLRQDRLPDRRTRRGGECHARNGRDQQVFEARPASYANTVARIHGTEASVAEQAEMVQKIAADHGGANFSWTIRPEDRQKLWRARHDVVYADRALRPGAQILATASSRAREGCCFAQPPERHWLLLWFRYGLSSGLPMITATVAMLERRSEPKVPFQYYKPRILERRRC
jgi:hypothetical protein